MSIRTNGWRQGAIVRTEDVGKFVTGIPLGSDDKLMIINQDCDVVCNSYDKEPNVEFLILKPVAYLDGSLSLGKNPRLIEVVLTDDSGEKYYQCSIHDRHLCPRPILETTTPDPSTGIVDKHLVAVQGWLAARYTRDAFPDEFNYRLPSRKFATALKRHGKFVSEILIALNPWDELDASENYEVRIVCTMLVGDYEDTAKKEASKRLVENISRVIDAADGINLESCELLSEEEVSLNDYRVFKTIYFDYLSYADIEASASAVRPST